MTDKKKRRKTIGLLVSAIIIVSAILAFSLNFLPPVEVSKFEAKELISLVGSLFFISLLVERFVEVFIADPNKRIKEKLEYQVELIEEDITAIRTQSDNGLLVSAHVFPEDAPIEPGDAGNLTKLYRLKESKTDTLEEYYNIRKNRILPIVYIIGLILSLFGIRILNDLIIDPLGGIQDILINIVDTVLTAAIIAGGSSGIHKIIKSIQRFTATGTA